MRKKGIILFLLLFFNWIHAQQKGAIPISINQHPVSNFKNTFAVVIGISDYQDPAIPDLRFANKDAEAFAEFLHSKGGGNLDGDHIKVLINNQATAGQIASALYWLVEETKEGDQVIIYFSGHGDVERKFIGQPGFLLCWDAPSKVYMAGGVLELGMLQTIISTLSLTNKANVIMISDACHSGKLAGSSINGSQLTNANLTKQYANEIKILSCQPNEYSIEGEQWGGGRGAFSYHLVDGLYGLADINSDGLVNLLEIGRYLEDKVTKEVAPENQLPITIGNRSENIAFIAQELLDLLKKNKSRQSSLMSPTDVKGIEEDVLAEVDTTVRNLYYKFKKYLNDKVLLEYDATGQIDNNSAESCFNKLNQEPKLEKLFSSMRRNYAAALQDDAQQAMNIWLKADVQQLECIGKSLKLEPIPHLLQRAMELLGVDHYMFRSLLARKLMFEGIVLSLKIQNSDQYIARKCLSLYKQAMELEPQSPLTWYNMSLIYLRNLHQTDSAFICAKEARTLAPNWILPYADLGYYLYNSLYEDNLAEQALLKAFEIDSTHPYIINRLAGWYANQPGDGNKYKALAMYEKYRADGGTLYPCWYNDYSIVLSNLGKYNQAEVELQNAIRLDSSKLTAWVNLGNLYSQMQLYHEAELAFKKAIALDSNYIKALNNLGTLYIKIRKFNEAENIFIKAISLDSNNVRTLTNLGGLYNQLQNYIEAEKIFKRAISIDSTYAKAWNGLGSLYNNTRNYAQAEFVLKKAISLDSTNAVAWSNFGFLLNMTGRFKEAEPIWNKSISIDSNSMNTWFNLGFLYLNTKQYDKAENVFMKTISLDSTNANQRKYLATVYFRSGRMEEARLGFSKALELNPNYFGGYLGMAYLFTSENKKTEAFTELEEAIKRGASYQMISNDTDLAPLRKLPEWKELIKRYFPKESMDNK